MVFRWALIRWRRAAVMDGGIEERLDERPTVDVHLRTHQSPGEDAPARWQAFSECHALCDAARGEVCALAVGLRHHRGPNCGRMQDFELVRLQEIQRLADERFLHLGRPNGLSESGVIKAAEDICVEAAEAVRLHKSGRTNQVKSADHHQGRQLCHRRRELDRDRARRAALLGAGWLGALAMLVPDAAHAQQGPFIYVPNLNGNDVTVIDTPTNTVAPTAITAGVAPLAAAVRGDQSLVYVTNLGDNTVSVINTATNTAVATIPVGNSPTLIALSPDNTLAYVANQGSNDVTVINTATNTVVATIPVGSQPIAPAVSPDGTRVYVTNTNSNTVSVINAATSTVIATIPAGVNPQGIKVTPNGSQVYVTNGGSGDISVINTTTNTVVATIAVGVDPRVVTFTRDGTRAYVANNGSDTVSIINTATNTVVGTIPVGTGPTGVVITPDGTVAYVTNTADNTVSIINIATNTVVGTLPVGLNPLVAGICSNGNALLGAGLTFKANTSGALACTLSSGPTGSPGPVFTGGTLQIAGANISSSLPITLQSQGGTVDTNGNNATLSGAISGPGGLSKIGAGTLTLSGQSTYTGATGVNAGTLQAGAVNAFSPFSAFTVASGATLNLASFNQTVGSLAGAGGVALGAATLTTGNDNTSTLFSGTISGTGGLTKIGSGMLLLTGVNNYAGPTNINAGILDVNGSLASDRLYQCRRHADGQRHDRRAQCLGRWHCRAGQLDRHAQCCRQR